MRPPKVVGVFRNKKPIFIDLTPEQYFTKTFAQTKKCSNIRETGNNRLIRLSRQTTY
jgi:hypothetical protein